MRRIAIFVEGQAEQIFIEKLLVEIAGTKAIKIETRRATGGSRGERSIRILKMGKQETSAQFHAMILDSTGECRVASDVRDQYSGLVKAGYTSIIGIRDVRPAYTQAQVPKLRQRMGYGLKTDPVRVEFILAVMELEAWFLGEHTHIQRICTGINLDAAALALGFDVRTADPEARSVPSADLDGLYTLGGKRYDKSKATVQATVNALDFELLCLDSAVRARIPSFSELLVALDRFFC